MLQNTFFRIRLNANQWTSGSEVALAEDDEVAPGEQGDVTSW